MTADIGRAAAAEADIDAVRDLGGVAVTTTHLIDRHLHLRGHSLTHDRAEPGSLIAAHRKDREASIEFGSHDNPAFTGSGPALVHRNAATTAWPRFGFLPSRRIERRLERFARFDAGHFSA